MCVSASFLSSFVRHGVMSIALLVSALGWSATPVPPPFVADELLVAFKPGTTAAALATASGGNSWSSTLTVAVHGADEAPISGVMVTTVADYGSSSDFLSCETDATGTCTTAALQVHKKNGSVSYSVQNLSISYSPQDNHDPDGDSDGTSIQISKA